jgi:hypothetical protein
MTYSGKHFHLLDPTPDEVDRLDIAHALSNVCRFTGHTKDFYSVATHSILCAEQARKDGMSARMQLLILLHDASEAYLTDVNRPLKEIIREVYEPIEEKVMETVWKHFNIPEPTDEEWKTVKHYDDFMLANEIGQLMMNADEFSTTPIYNGVYLPRFSNVHVKNRFIDILEHLLIEVEEEKKHGK